MKSILFSIKASFILLIVTIFFSNALAYDAVTGYVTAITCTTNGNASIFNSNSPNAYFINPDLVGATQADRMYAQLLTALAKGKQVRIGTQSSTTYDITYVTIIR